MFKTADLYDAHPAEVHVAAPLFQHFGGRKRFCGPIVTLQVYEDNVLVHEQLKEPGEGRVIVIDGAGSLRHAIVGDILSQRAHMPGRVRAWSPWRRPSSAAKAGVSARTVEPRYRCHWQGLYA